MNESSTGTPGSRAELRAAFIEARGYWSPLWDGVLALDERFFAAYLRFSERPWNEGPLDPKVKELVYVAIDVATTHLYEPGIRIHVHNALRHGASPAEIMDVLELASGLGIHTCTVGAPILLEELGEQAAGTGPLSAAQQELKQRFTAAHGHWEDRWEALLRLDPGFFEAYLDLTAASAGEGHVEPKVRELLHVAICAATTHLHEPALRAHVRRALRLGATAHEIMEVFELTSVLGIHACTVGVPILIAEADLEVV